MNGSCVRTWPNPSCSSCAHSSGSATPPAPSAAPPPLAPSSPACSPPWFGFEDCWAQGAPLPPAPAPPAWTPPCAGDCCKPFWWSPACWPSRVPHAAPSPACPSSEQGTPLPAASAALLLCTLSTSAKGLMLGTQGWPVLTAAANEPAKRDTSRSTTCSRASRACAIGLGRSDSSPTVSGQAVQGTSGQAPLGSACSFTPATVVGVVSGAAAMPPSLVQG